MRIATICLIGGLLFHSNEYKFRVSGDSYVAENKEIHETYAIPRTAVMWIKLEKK